MGVIKIQGKHYNKIMGLIPQCCNYDNGECMALDCKCVQQGCMTSILCKWFRDGVLPSDVGLYADIMACNKMNGAYTKNCKACNKTYSSTSKTSQYCPKCRDKVYKNRYRKYNQEKRAI